VSDTRKRIVIDAPSEMVILAARHLDANEGRVQIGSSVDPSTRSAITTVLRYIATAHNSPAVEEPTAARREVIADTIRRFPFDNYGLGDVSYLLEETPDTQEWVAALADAIASALDQPKGHRAAAEEPS
jgi:hypothetical protein